MRLAPKAIPPSTVANKIKPHTVSNTLCVRQSGHILGSDFDIKEMLTLSLPGGRCARIQFPQFLLDDHRLLASLLSKIIGR